MKLRMLIITCGAAAVLVLTTPSSTAATAAAPKPDRVKARHDAIEASLVTKEPVPQLWLQEPIHAGQVVQELEDAWRRALELDPPGVNRPGKKTNAERRRERDDSVERRDVFLACFERHRKDDARLFRFNGGPGKPFGYVIMKQAQALYWFPIGTNPPH